MQALIIGTLASLQTETAISTQAPSKFTPGPWSIDCDGGHVNYEHVAISADGRSDSPWRGLAQVVVTMDGKQFEEGEANARLIAAAPDLLLSLQHLLSWVDGLPIKHLQQAGHREMARCTIARAMGNDFAPDVRKGPTNKQIGRPTPNGKSEATAFEGAPELARCQSTEEQRGPVGVTSPK